jgi:iron(II)-dependent oxidoreductase
MDPRGQTPGQVLIGLLVLFLLVGVLAAQDEMVLIPAGPFTMGNDHGPSDERPAHRVVLSAFRIDRNKVTNQEFALFLNANGVKSLEGEDRYDWDDSDARIHRREGGFRADPGSEQHPAVEVSWFGARDYCAWKGKRLPTEAEWEKAARGTNGRQYPWGNALPTPARAVYGRSYNTTEPVGMKPAGVSPYAVHEMIGNLREWTASQYRPYPYRADDGRESLDPKGTRVVRGASHDDGADSLRVTIRRRYDHRGFARGHHFLGFRCVKIA